jgi:hypothetical protein
MALGAPAHPLRAYSRGVSDAAGAALAAVSPSASACPAQRACASIPGTRTPRPSHHGQETSLGVPPRFDITWPVPRQAIHSRAS